MSDSSSSSSSPSSSSSSPSVFPSSATSLTSIGEYTFNPRKPLGHGNSCTVFRATNAAGVPVALKLLNKSSLNTPATLGQVQKEISALTQLNHTSIIKLYNVDQNARYTNADGVTQDVVLIALELAEGGELFGWIQLTGSFNEPLSRHYFIQLLEALHHSHSNGIAHRDLKPENLLMGANNVLKIADFGLSGFFSPSSAAGATLRTACGTRAYMAPEIGKPSYDATKADIWAAGVILFILVAGFPPFAGAFEKDWWFHKLSIGRLDLFWNAHLQSARFTTEFMDLINNMLAVDPSQRYTIRQVASHNWIRGTRLSDDEVRQEMSRRHEVLLHEKAIRERAALSSVGNDSDEVHRGPPGGDNDDDDDDDDEFDFRSDRLPKSSPPPLFLNLGVPPRTEDEDEDEDDTVSASTTTLLLPTGSISLLTTIVSAVPANATKNRVTACLNRLKVSVKEESGSPHSLSCVVDDVGRRLAFDVNFFTLEQASSSSPSSPSNVCVEFRRLDGDSSSFTQFFVNVRTSLQDIILFKKTS